MCAALAYLAMAPKKAQNLVLRLHAEGLSKAEARLRLKSEHGYKPSRISQLMQVWPAPNEVVDNDVQTAGEEKEASTDDEDCSENCEGENIYAFPSVDAAVEFLHALPADGAEAADDADDEFVVGEGDTTMQTMEESFEDEEACALMLLAA